MKSFSKVGSTLLIAMTLHIFFDGSHVTIAQELTNTPSMLPGASEVFSASGDTRYDALMDRLEALEAEVQSYKLQPPTTDLTAFEAYHAAPGTLCNFGSEAKGCGSTLPCECPKCKEAKAKDKDKKEYPTVRATGVVQIDAGWFDQDQASMDTVGDIQDGCDFRRARFAFVGNLAEDYKYMFELEFTLNGTTTLFDCWAEANEVPILGNVRVGRWRQPFGMDELTSVRDLTFLERFLGFTFAPFRQTGIGFYDSDEESATTWAASLFRFPSDRYGGNIGDDGGYSGVGRVTTLLFEDPGDHMLFHIGGSYGLIFPSNAAAQFRSQPEFAMAELPGAQAPDGVPLSVPFFVNTGDFASNHYQIFNLETAFQYHSFVYRGESRFVSVDQTGGDNLLFFSSYGQVSYILTGEVQPYNRKSGVFGRIKPERPFKPGSGDWGAWEVASRLSWIDLDSGNIDGNRLCDYTAGLNWYVNNNLKFQFNYIYAMLDGKDIPRSNTSIIALRTQFDF